MQRKRRSRLVELLVVIAIIGILVALLLPAVNAARSGTTIDLARIACVKTCLPCSLTTMLLKLFLPVDWVATVRAAGLCKGANKHGISAFAYILPFIERKATYDLIKFPDQMLEQ